MFLAAFRGGRHQWSMTEVVGDGRLAMCEWTFTMAVPSVDESSTRLRFDGASVFALTDGRCHSYREFFDRGSTLLAQSTPERAARLVARYPSVELLPPALVPAYFDGPGRAEQAAT